MFTIATKENTQQITLTDKFGRGHAPAIWNIARGVKSIAWAVLSYAKQCDIEPNEVNYSVIIHDNCK